MNSLISSIWFTEEVTDVEKWPVALGTSAFRWCIAWIILWRPILLSTTPNSIPFWHTQVAEKVFLSWWFSLALAIFYVFSSHVGRVDCNVLGLLEKYLQWLSASLDAPFPHHSIGICVRQNILYNTEDFVTPIWRKLFVLMLKGNVRQGKLFTLEHASCHWCTRYSKYNKESTVVFTLTTNAFAK